MVRQAVILAAGTGSRLRPLTNTTPKCLIDVGGLTILERLLRQLAEAGIFSAIIITGYLSETIQEFLESVPSFLDVKLVVNPEYLHSNNAVSLLQAQKIVNEEAFLLCDGDVVLKTNLFKTLLEEPETSALLVDPFIPLGAEEMKVITTKEGEVQKLSKLLSPSSCDGESIGIQKIGKNAVPQLWQELSHMMQNGRQNAYYEEAFQRLIDQNIRFQSVLIPKNSWIEIDDLTDLDTARARFTNS